MQDTPMNRADYLLSHLAQECAEVIVRITKAQMFGLDEIQPGQEFTNHERVMHEMADVIAIGDGVEYVIGDQSWNAHCAPGNCEYIDHLLPKTPYSPPSR